MPDQFLWGHSSRVCDISCCTLIDLKLGPACVSFHHAVKNAGKVHDMKPVQNCTGFIFCTFHAIVYLYIFVSTGNRRTGPSVKVTTSHSGTS